MKSISNVFFKSIVSPFYQRHAGLFLVLFLLLFGVIPPQNLVSYHLKLMDALLGDVIFRSLIFILWLLYMFKCIQFVFQLLGKPEYDFLSEINATRLLKKVSAALNMSLWLLLPVLCYAILLMVYAVHLSLLFPAFQVLTACILLIAGCASLLVYRISKKHGKGLSAFLNFLTIRTKKTYIVIMLLHILSDLKIVFGVTKLLSIVCLLIAFAFCDDNVFDIRIVMLGLLFASLSHTMLIFEIRKFEETQLPFIRNFPVNIFKKWFHYLVISCVLAIPELLLIINVTGSKIRPDQIPVLFAFGAAMLLSFFASFYKLPFNKDKSIIYPAYIVMIIFFLVLYHQVMLIIGGLLAYSFFVLRNNYYKFELVEEK